MPPGFLGQKNERQRPAGCGLTELVVAGGDGGVPVSAGREFNMAGEVGRKRAAQVVVGLGKDLFHQIVAEGGVPAWNSFVSDLFKRELLSVAWSPKEIPPPFIVMIDLAGIRLDHRRLDGINLIHCWLEGASFDGSSLKNARLGCGRKVSYRGASIQGSDFRYAEISGCDFTGCKGIENAMFDGATYDDPPIGLPPAVMARCSQEPDSADCGRFADPTGPSEFGQAPLRCRASFHLIPIEA